jgi:hypothetical protein
MAWCGLAQSGLVGLGTVATGLPAAFVLIAVAALGAAVGLATGTVSFGPVVAVAGTHRRPARQQSAAGLAALCRHGIAARRLPLIDALHRAGNAVLPRRAAAPLVSAMTLGALLGPTNGSVVDASALALSRVVAPRLNGEGVPSPTRDAVITVASTLCWCRLRSFSSC